MSWIKTNFLWMMYRCRWCTKTNQERVLAVRISREGFDTILSKALTGKDEKEKGLKSRSEVRLQWDPDHAPSGLPEKRRAIQLGLRDEVNTIHAGAMQHINRRCHILHTPFSLPITVGPLYNGHPWGTTLWLLYRGGCSSGVRLLWKSM